MELNRGLGFSKPINRNQNRYQCNLHLDGKLSPCLLEFFRELIFLKNVTLKIKKKFEFIYKIILLRKMSLEKIILEK